LTLKVIIKIIKVIIKIKLIKSADNNGMNSDNNEHLKSKLPIIFRCLICKFRQKRTVPMGSYVKIKCRRNFKISLKKYRYIFYLYF